MSERTHHLFQYAILRFVPDLERGEGRNVGLVLGSRPLRFVAARTHLDEDAMRGFAGDVDLALIAAHLRAIEAIAAGTASASPIAALSPSERFHWLVAPSSTMLQPSPAHTGVTADPAAELDRLFTRLVLPPAR